MKTTAIKIPIKHHFLSGDLTQPEDVIGLVIFSHGSGSSRFSTRNKLVANQLNQHKIATLLFDLLTVEEDSYFENRFNIDLLTTRLIEITQWILETTTIKKLPIGYFGASTGAASAVRAAAYFGPTIKALVSRGGRPDLAIPALPKVTAPTLLIVGELDDTVVEMNRVALLHLNTQKELKVIPGATHLFEEAGALEQVADVAVSWFEDCFTKQFVSL